jgi:DNA-directed RNA polymerase specialized sigma24 family protein
VRRASEGDSSAWAELVEAHLEAVWSLAVRLLPDPDDAAAVCETVWLRLAQDVTVADGERLATWLARAVWDEARRASPADLVVDRRRADALPGGRVLPLQRSRGRMA